MASNVKRDHHSLRRNLKLNGNYISNDGDDEGITIDDGGIVTMSSRLNIGDPDVDYASLTVAANGATTLSTEDAVGALANLDIIADGAIELATTNSNLGHITLDSHKMIILEAEDGITITAGSGDDIEFTAAATRWFAVGIDHDVINFNASNPSIILTSLLDEDKDVNLHLNSVTGDFSILSPHSVSIDADGDIILDADGHVEFDGCGVGFDLVEPTYDSTTTIVDFRTGNKQLVTFDGGNITYLSMYFPATSGNFVVLVKQDGTGGRTITNYRTYDVDVGNVNDLRFPGAANPDLTDDANFVDIISVFWDADSFLAYGVATLNFDPT